MNMHEKEAMRQEGLAIAFEILEHTTLKEWEMYETQNSEKGDVFEVLKWVLEDEFPYDEGALKQRLIKEMNSR